MQQWFVCEHVKSKATLMANDPRSAREMFLDMLRSVQGFSPEQAVSVRPLTEVLGVVLPALLRGALAGISPEPVATAFQLLLPKFIAEAHAASVLSGNAQAQKGMA